METIAANVGLAVLILAVVIAGAITAFLYLYLRSQRRRQASDDPQSILGPRYRLGDELGRGMNAVTYRVQDVGEPHIPLAAKLLLTSSDDPRISHESFARHIARFEREMDNLEKLQGSSYVVPVHAFHRNALRPFFVMHYCESSLSKRFQRHPMDMQDMVDVLSSVCRGLMESHQQRIIHRDLKPSNVLCCKGQWVLADFGMSLLGADDSRVTVPESLAGTLPYTAPEVIYPGVAPVGPPADVFSLGVTIMWMLTGSTDRDFGPSMRLQSCVDDRTRREVTFFDDLVGHMMNLIPSERPQTIDDVCRHLHLMFSRVADTRRNGKVGLDAPVLERLNQFLPGH